MTEKNHYDAYFVEGLRPPHFKNNPLFWVTPPPPPPPFLKIPEPPSPLHVQHKIFK